MSNIKKDKTDELLWLRPLETTGSQYDDGLRRPTGQPAVQVGDLENDLEAREWFVIEKLILAWKAPRDS